MDPIGEHAILGDGRSAALVSRRGSIDWLCWPRFDSPPLFGSLLDRDAGHFTIAPAGLFDAERRYVPETNVLRTRFRATGGVATLTDLMPVASEEDKQRMLVPEHELLRVVECEEGEVDLIVDMRPRPGFGRERPRVREAGRLGVAIDTRAGRLFLRSDAPLRIEPDGSIRAELRLRAGEAVSFSLVLAVDGPAVLPPLGARSWEAIERSIAWWRRWLRPFRYDGPARDAVVRSALALKLLVHAPSGAIIAAPTTSLPERIGGALNWDYRYCWLRDASLTMRALAGLGFGDEAAAFMGWLLHTTRLTRPRLRILYDVYGNRPPQERELGHLAGHLGSRPVRVGNAAMHQLQLDVYGEVIDAAARFARSGGRFDLSTGRMLAGFGRFVCQHWREPDEGIWEPRSGRRENTHSRLLCWTALDRLLELHVEGHLPSVPVAELRRQRRAIRRDIEERAWNDAVGSYAAVLGGDEVDASLLLLSWYGFEDPASDRMRATHARVRAELDAGGGLLYRYRSGESPGEGAFGICSFWAVDHLARGGGSAEEAAALFEQLCGYANDVGLFAEEIDPSTGAPLGNFPQAFTHVGLVNAALSLDRRLAGHGKKEIQMAMTHAEARR